MKTTLVYKWSFIRIIRVIAGSYLLINGIIYQEHVFVGLGALILIQGIMNLGCEKNCAHNSCNVKIDENGKV